MMKNNMDSLPANPLVTIIFATSIFLISATALQAQSPGDNAAIQPLRSDVGINGLTVNLHALGDYSYLGNDTLQTDGSSELEFVFRNIRMMSPRVGVGFQVLGSFFVDNSGDESGFGLGSWGLGPMVRAYPFKTNRFQPYVQGKALFGNNMAVGELANTRTGGEGFRVRLGLRGGVAYRISNTLGFFVEVGPDWESGRIFRADARTMQVNVGIDLYRFN
ncbi:hypothetical protein SAMN05443144_10694 [Fodinibius roseus]|uniref:Outer membrane protein beta-barrel domain-containing protein n=1 Tax=Fodinibius roseus TaxID=1194090 RepID=A0A1M4ZPQ0_9BACT|nr:hypothetical protein [Fodinibius roseus]SHF19905.1 hypothetical protein SAMN05443144_10694 [Fodinibius roseus]